MTPTVYRVVAGIDVHKKMLAVVVRREAPGELEYEKRKFGAARSEIGHLAAWLQHHHVEEVVMESTAQYWRPVWYGLEAGFPLHLSHPLKTKAPRGRKRDFRDAQRLADRWCSGDLEESFVPQAEQRSWRWLTRTRVDLKEKIGVVRNQVEGLLEQGGFKLTAVASDVFGVSGWAMLEQIAAGESRAEVLVQEARAALKKKTTELADALTGHLEPTYRFLLQQYLDQVRLLRRQIGEINAQLAVVMQAHMAAFCRLCQIPGVQMEAAQELLAEVGPGAAAFPSAEQFASWVGVCPGSTESAGICYSSRSAKGNRYLRRLLTQIAWAAIHVKETFFAELFGRLRPRLGAKGSAWAVAHRIAKVIWLVLHEEVSYQERGATPPDPRTLLRKLNRLTKQFQAQGMDIASLLQQLAPAS